MELNNFGNRQKFDKIFEQRFPGTQTIFRAINPYFFNFLRPDGAIAEDIEPLEGVKISWGGASRLPIIILEDLEINEEAQLFYQMYESQIVGIGM